MIQPSFDHRSRPASREPTWQQILVSYAMLAAIPAVLWIAAQPSTRILAVVAAVGVYVTTRRLHRLLRCFYDCKAMTFDIGESVRITIRQPSTCSTH